MTIREDLIMILSYLLAEITAFNFSNFRLLIHDFVFSIANLSLVVHFIFQFACQPECNKAETTMKQLRLLTDSIIHERIITKRKANSTSHETKNCRVPSICRRKRRNNSRGNKKIKRQSQVAEAIERPATFEKRNTRLSKSSVEK